MKKLACVVGGWHWPGHFYESMRTQEVASGWEYAFFVVTHRQPAQASSLKEKKELSNKLSSICNPLRDSLDNRMLLKLDELLYSKPIPDYSHLSYLGWKIIEAPNTIGDMEFLNQWSSLYDYSDFDCVLLAHDDTLLLENSFIRNVLEGRYTFYQKKGDGIKLELSQESCFDSWSWLCNSHYPSYYHIRNSLDFIKREVIECVQGSFRHEGIRLDRSGLTNDCGFAELSDWNAWSEIIVEQLRSNGFLSGIRYVSPFYRISPGALECERGLVSSLEWESGNNIYIKGIRAHKDKLCVALEGAENLRKI